MADKGYKDVAVTSWDTLRFRWWIDSQSIANNTTTLGWAMELIATGAGRINATATCPWEVTVNGTTYSGSVNVGIANNTTKTLASGTTNIAHNSDGTKTFSFEFSQYFGITFSGVWITTKSGSGTGTLDTIPRASAPTVSTSSVDMGGTVTISTNRANTSFTHDLAYSFAGGSYVSIATGVGTSYSWNTPDLASSIPNAASGTLTIRCITKSGSTTIGTKTVAMTLKVPTSVVPTISGVSVTEATSGLAAQFGTFIQGKSALTVTVNAAGAKGSTIKTYKTVLLGVSHDEKTFTTDTVTQAGTFDLVATVTDTRGRTASKTVSIKVLPYAVPSTSEFKAFRSNESGSPADEGTYLSVAYAYSVASCGGKNTAAMVIEYKRTTASSWTQLATGSDLEGSGIRFFADGPTFSTDYQFDVRMTVTDWFGASTTYEVTLPTADVVLDISADGKGLGIGKVAQRSGATEFARTMYDMFGALIGNGLAKYRDDEYNQIDPDVTLEHLIVTDHEHAPETGFWYIMTMFYSTKADTANRMQLALPYSTDGSLWTRRYYNGAWTSWKATPVKTQEYDSGIWHVRTWSDGWVELTGSHEVADLPCTTALGNWYRTAVFTPPALPVKLTDPLVTANYESAGYGALLWATTEATETSAPSYYLIRPTSATIASGRVQLRVTGRRA